MLVTLCVIAYNEEAFLPNLFNDIKNQTYDHRKMEIILVDNGSQDGTKSLMDDFAENSDFFKVKVVSRERGNQAQGWNTAFLNTTGSVIIKADAHGSLPKDFVQANIAVISEGEYVCGGGRPNIAANDTPWDNTLLAAEECMFGGGFAKYRHKQQKKEYINSIFNGAYRTEVLARVGGFNEALGRTEDNEFHYRITKAGYKICCSPKITSYQYIRSSLPKMIKQKYSNGYWIGLTVKAFPKCLSLFHFAPLALVLSLLVCAVFAVCGVSWLMLALLTAYLLFDAFITFNAFKSKKRCAQFFCLPIIFPLLHLSYGIGTLVGIIHPPIRKDNLTKARKRIREVKRYYLEH